MDLSRTFQISADYKDRSSPISWDMLLFAEVVFIDKTHLGNRPLIYQLNDHKLTLEKILNISKPNCLSFSRDAFLLIGEVLFIDKKKKQISLTNNNIVSYNHLVIASGKKTILSFQDDELLAALQALTDALRVKPKIPASFPTNVKNSLQSSAKKETTFAASDRSVISQDEQNIEKIVHPYIMAVPKKLNSCGLDALNSRFYEVQT